MGGCGLDGKAGREELAARADFDLRSAFGIVDAGAGRAQPPANLSRDGAAVGRVCGAHGIHPRRVVADHGAPVLRFVGIPDDGVLRADRALRHSAGFHVPGGLPASAWHWSDSRLGSVALPCRRTRSRVLRRHALVRAFGFAARDSIPTGRHTSSITGATRFAAF